MSELVKRMADALREANEWAVIRHSALGELIADLLEECAAAERGEGQPVAWGSFNHGSWNVALRREDMGPVDYRYAVPLYAAPPAAPEGIDAQLAGFLSAELPQLHHTHPGDVLAAIDKFRAIAAASNGQRG